MLDKTEEIVEMPLFLSRWDAAVPVFIPVDVLEDIKDYHLMGIRFLYDCLRKDKKGAILNHESDMNFPIQVSAFFNALSKNISPQSPVLILSPEKSINAWLYHLTVHGGFNVTILSSQNSKEIMLKETHQVVLTTVDNTQLLKEIKEIDFFSIVIDEFDLVATKAIIKQLEGQFKIGLTTRNFLKCPDQKLFWTMLNWSNPGVLGKLADFGVEDTDHLINFRNPYRDWWQRLTWKFCDNFKAPTIEEQEQCKTQIRKWLAQNKIARPKIEPKRETRRLKRKIASDLIKIECKIENEEPSQTTLEDHSSTKREAQNSKRIILSKPVRNKHETESEEPKQNVFEKIYNPLNTKNTSNVFHNGSSNIKNHNLLDSLSNHAENILNQNNSYANSPCKDDFNKSNSQKSNSSQDTIIYETQNSPSSNDENPILTSILTPNSNLMLFDEVKYEYDVEVDEDDILTSIIKN